MSLLDAHVNTVGQAAPCSIWPGAKTVAGYGYYYEKTGPRDRRKRYVHRRVWEEANGPIPDGLEILHLCDNPSCVELTHLRLGTHADNMRDMAEKGRGVGWNGTKTHCPQGHPYDDANTTISKRGFRKCKQCAREYAERKRRNRGAVPWPDHCPQGHEFTEENTGWKLQPHGGVARRCRTCARIYTQEYRLRQKEN